MRQAQAQEQAGRGPQEGGGRGRPVVERAIHLAVFADRRGAQFATIITQAALEAVTLAVQTLDRVDAQFVDVGRRNEGFLADGLEVARKGLHPDRAVPVAARALHQVGAAFPAVRVEDRAGLADILKLGVGVVRVAVGSAQGREGAVVEAIFAPNIIAFLVQLDEDGLLGDRAVFTIGILVGGAQESLVADIGTADAPGLQIRITVGLGSAFAPFHAVGCGLAGGQGRGGNVVIVRLALHAIDVEGETAAAEGDAAERAAAVVDAGRLGGDDA